MSPDVWVKICGVTSVEDALLAASVGADAIGINLISRSKRVVSTELAREIAAAVSDRLHVIGVVADLAFQELIELREQLGLDALQLHGQESPDLVAALLPDAFKVIHVASQGDADRALDFAGETLLVEGKVNGELGGTGQTWDFSLVRALAEKRKVIVAGGLTPENVRAVIEQVEPWGVDVASGTEVAHDPRRKDPERVKRFVEQARAKLTRS